MTTAEPTSPTPKAGEPPLAAMGVSVVCLPGGRTFDLRRSRWEGVLDADELAYCRAHGIELAYDCSQVGWVTAACTDASPPAVGGERAVDLTAFTFPEQEAMRMLRTLSAQLERIGVELPAAAAAAEAIDRLGVSIATSVAECRARHGVVAASRWHLAAQARMVRAAAPREEVAPAGDEFSFRPWTRADAPRYRAMLDNPRLWRFLPEGHHEPLTEATALALIDLGNFDLGSVDPGSVDPGSVDERQHAFAVVRGGEPIGQCLLRQHQPFAGMRTAEVAYWLAEEHWGKGWMSRILPKFVTHCFAHFEVEVLEAWIHEDHAASARVARRSGFRRDQFAFEAELAVARNKPQAQRHVAYRGAFAALRTALPPPAEPTRSMV